MSADAVTNVKTKNTWIIALLVSMAVNGLLVGLLLSKQIQPDIVRPELPPAQNAQRIVPNNPRHLVRTLSPKRRKQVMTTAMKNLDVKGEGHPRPMFKLLQQAKMKTMSLLGADELDTAAIEQSLADIRALNQKLAVSGDALMLEVLAQLTPEERKTAREALQKRKNMRHRKPNRREHQLHQP